MTEQLLSTSTCRLDSAAVRFPTSMSYHPHLDFESEEQEGGEETPRPGCGLVTARVLEGGGAYLCADECD